MCNTRRVGDNVVSSKEGGGGGRGDIMILVTTNNVAGRAVHLGCKMAE